MLQKTHTQKNIQKGTFDRLRPSEFSSVLVSWYSKNKRDLPWRETQNPYEIWLSEIILQQTRVLQGLPYYRKFIRKYPTVSDLAIADEVEVLRVWQGLGYYSRARNLHKCAKIIHSNHNGIFPSTYDEILKLPGVGVYTAAAISSFAFGLPSAVVDGNVYRVLARVYGISEDISSGKGQKAFKNLASQLLDIADPATYNQSIMEFGALQCVPKSPDCSICPLADPCKANMESLQSKLPVKTRKTKVKKRSFHYFCFVSNDKILMRKRVERDIWLGLYDFPLTETSEMTELDVLLQNDESLSSLVKEAKGISESKEYLHILSHQRIQAKFYTVKLGPGQTEESIKSKYDRDNYKWFTLSEVIDMPKAVLVSKYLNDEIFD